MSFLDRLFGSAGASSRITPADFKARFFGGAAPHTLIDVRTPEEFAAGSIPGAVNIPVHDLSTKLEKIPRDRPAVVYCRTGSRSAMAAGLLRQRGYSDVLDLGGIVAWQAAGYPLKRP